MRRVRASQRRVEPIQRVTVTVIVERVGLVALMASHRAVTPVTVFVYVVTVMEHEAKIGRIGDMIPGGEVSVFVMLAAGCDDSQALNRGVRSGRGAGPPDLARGVQRVKTAEIRAIRRQTGYLHPHGVTEFGEGDRASLARRSGERRVLGQFPFQRHGLVGQSTATQRIGGEPRL